MPSTFFSTWFSNFCNMELNDFNCDITGWDWISRSPFSPPDVVDRIKRYMTEFKAIDFCNIAFVNKYCWPCLVAPTLFWDTIQKQRQKKSLGDKSTEQNPKGKNVGRPSKRNSSLGLWKLNDSVGLNKVPKFLSEKKFYIFILHQTFSTKVSRAKHFCLDYTPAYHGCGRPTLQPTETIQTIRTMGWFDLLLPSQLHFRTMLSLQRPCSLPNLWQCLKSMIPSEATLLATGRNR